MADPRIPDEFKRAEELYQEDIAMPPVINQIETAKSTADQQGLRTPQQQQLGSTADELRSQLQVVLARQLEDQRTIHDLEREAAYLYEQNQRASQIVTFYETVVREEHAQQVGVLRAQLDEANEECHYSGRRCAELGCRAEGLEALVGMYKRKSVALTVEVEELNERIEQIQLEKWDAQTDVEGWDRISEKDVDEVWEDEGEEDKDEESVPTMGHGDIERGSQEVYEDCEWIENVEEESGFEEVTSSERDEDWDTVTEDVNAWW